MNGVSVIEIAHMVGPMWSVNGHAVVVPPGTHAPSFVMAHVASGVTAPGPWPIRVTDGARVSDLVLGVDGSVTERPAEAPAATRWWRR